MSAVDRRSLKVSSELRPSKEDVGHFETRTSLRTQRIAVGEMHFRPRGVRIRPQELGPKMRAPRQRGRTAHSSRSTELASKQVPATTNWSVASGLLLGRGRLSRPSRHNVLSCTLTLPCISPWIFATLCSVCLRHVSGSLYLPWGPRAPAFAVETFPHVQPLLHSP